MHQAAPCDWASFLWDFALEKGLKEVIRTRRLAAQLPTLTRFWLAQSSTNTDIGTASATFLQCGWMYQTLWWCKWPCKKQLLHWISNHESWDSNLVLLIPLQLKNHTSQLAPRFNTPLPKPEKINLLSFKLSYFPILGSFAKLLLLYCKRFAFHSCQTKKKMSWSCRPKKRLSRWKSDFRTLFRRDGAARWVLCPRQPRPLCENARDRVAQKLSAPKQVPTWVTSRLLLQESERIFTNILDLPSCSR